MVERLTAASTVQDLRERFKEARQKALSKHRRGVESREVVARLSRYVDAILVDAFDGAVGDAAKRLALVAVGGYGRLEFCPRSDIDLLVLHRRDEDLAEVEKLVRLLWDSGEKLGHAVRTVPDCLRFMLSDHSTATSVLESRFLAGSRALYDEFQSLAVSKFRKTRSKPFSRTKLELIRNSLADPARTIYTIEPNLKEGICGLRDIQRVVWVQNIRGEGERLVDLARQRKFYQHEVERVLEAYSFYLRVRCELHFSTDVHQDILERDSQLDVARNLGYGVDRSARETVEALMGDYYRHARHVYRFLRFYLETGTRGYLFLNRIHWRLAARKVGDQFAVHRRRLFFRNEAPETSSFDELLEIFRTAQREGVRLSEVLCDWIRRQVDRISDDVSRSSSVQRTFVSILRDGRALGRLLKTMHATGVLGRVIPEFAALDCLVSFDGHHQFTVDEHTLKTLAELERIETQADYPEPAFQKVLEGVEDKLPLRLALLLHDIGKPLPGEHSVSGTEAAVVICERFGVEPRTIDTVEFLVYRHLALFSYSQRRDLNDQASIAALARLVETEERLNMLYLLTYIDIKSVGPSTWTGWKGSQLAELYERTLEHLRTGKAPGDPSGAVVAASDLSEDEQRRVLEHCEQVASATYRRETVPERMLEHVRMVERFHESHKAQVAVERAVGCSVVTFCCADRARLFSDLAGLLYSEGLNVLGARVFSRADGIVLGVFQVEVGDAVTIGVEERVERLRRKLRVMEQRTKAMDDFLRERERREHSPQHRKPLFGPSVSVANNSSEHYSIVEVNAGDRPRLLYDLAVALNRLTLDVRAAKVSTLTDRAHDVFYVLETDGSKATNPARIESIRQELLSEAKR